MFPIAAMRSPFLLEGHLDASTVLVAETLDQVPKPKTHFTQPPP